MTTADSAMMRRLLFDPQAAQLAERTGQLSDYAPLTPSIDDATKMRKIYQQSLTDVAVPLSRRSPDCRIDKVAHFVSALACWLIGVAVIV